MEADNPSGRRNSRAESAGAIRHLPVQGDQRRIEALRDRNVQRVWRQQSQIEAPQKSVCECDVSRLDLDPLR